MARPLTASDLPPDLARFAEAQVAADRFPTVEDVLRAGKEALEHEQRRQERKLATLRDAIAEGDASPDAGPGVFERIRAKYGLPAARVPFWVSFTTRMHALPDAVFERLPLRKETPT